MCGWLFFNLFSSVFLIAFKYHESTTCLYCHLLSAPQRTSNKTTCLPRLNNTLVFFCSFSEHLGFGYFSLAQRYTVATVDEHLSRILRRAQRATCAKRARRCREDKGSTHTVWRSVMNQQSLKIENNTRQSSRSSLPFTCHLCRTLNKWRNHFRHEKRSAQCGALAMPRDINGV